MGVRKTSATVQWTDGAKNGQPIITYTIFGRTKWNQTWINLTEGWLLCLYIKIITVLAALYVYSVNL